MAHRIHKVREVPLNYAVTVYRPVRIGHEEGGVHGTSVPVQRPFGGSHWSHTPNTSWRMRPSQKIGITQMIVPYRRTARSTDLSRFDPASTPRGMPTKEATSIPPIASSTVAGKRTEIWFHTGWPRYSSPIEVPRLPVKIFRRYVKY